MLKYFLQLLFLLFPCIETYETFYSEATSYRMYKVRAFESCFCHFICQNGHFSMALNMLM